jgi:hypothetical protein
MGFPVSPMVRKLTASADNRNIQNNKFLTASIQIIFPLSHSFHLVITQRIRNRSNLISLKQNVPKRIVLIIKSR